MNGLSSFLLANWWLLLLTVLIIALAVNYWLLFREMRSLQSEISEELHVTQSALLNTSQSVHEMRRTVVEMGNSIQPLTGYPAHIEATWEDVGARGRFLTDLGGMSIGMAEQQQRIFEQALNKPLTTEPAAGSIADVMSDLDAWLTGQTEIEALTWGEKQSRGPAKTRTG